MNPTKIDDKRNVAKGELKQKSANLAKDDQLIIKHKTEEWLGKRQINSGLPKDGNYKSQTPATTQWITDWGVHGGEKRRIEVCQSEVKNRKYGRLNKTAFLF